MRTQIQIPQLRRKARGIRQRGTASVLAMMYLMLFSAVALGFYAQTNISAQISANERRIAEAQLEAESGMQFIRYHLNALDVTHIPDPDRQFEEVYMALAERLDGTANLRDTMVGYNGNHITIPEKGYIPTHDGRGFRARIKNMGQKLVVKVVGRAGEMTTGSRAIEMDYAVAENASEIFDYGIASRGSVRLLGNARITGVPASRGSLLSTSMTGTAVTLEANAAIAGDVSMVNPNGTVSVTGGASIAGSTNPAVYQSHIHKGVDAPEFPVIDTQAYRPYATTILMTPGAKYDAGTLRNILIKAGTNPTFDSNLLIEGVVYIEQPNKVQFNSNVRINGVIVVDNTNVGSSATNSITFQSNVKVGGAESIPNTPDFPEGLRALTGASILAPNFNVYCNSNFGISGGSVVAGRLTFDSNAVGTIKGSVIVMEDYPLEMKSNSAITIESMGTEAYPSGVFFGHRYTALPDTYREVSPEDPVPTEVVLVDDMGDLIK